MYGLLLCPDDIVQNIGKVSLAFVFIAKKNFQCFPLKFVLYFFQFLYSFVIRWNQSIIRPIQWIEILVLISPSLKCSLKVILSLVELKYLLVRTQLLSILLLFIGRVVKMSEVRRNRKYFRMNEGSFKNIICDSADGLFWILYYLFNQLRA